MTDNSANAPSSPLGSNRLQKITRNQGQSSFPTVRSTGDLSLALPKSMRDDVLDGQRSRSHSAPLTMEALAIAKELQKVSDKFNSSYMYRKRGNEHRKDKQRRKTVSACERSAIQREFDRSLWKESGYENIVSAEELRRSSRENILEIPEDGTPV